MHTVLIAMELVFSLDGGLNKLYEAIINAIAITSMINTQNSLVHLINPI